MVDIEVHTKNVDSLIRNVRKDKGIFFTPQWVIDFMVGLIDEEVLEGRDGVKILEPACGICQFLYGIRKNKGVLFDRSSKVGVEIDGDVVDYVYKNGLVQDIDVVCSDYLLWETDESFDIILGNPPYGIPSSSEHYAVKVEDEVKGRYKEIYETWYGKYNIYGAFVEKSVKLLRERGQLIFIVPASFFGAVLIPISGFLSDAVFHLAAYWVNAGYHGTRLVASLPGAYLRVGTPSPAELLAFYGLFAGVFFWKRGWGPRAAAGACLVVLVGFGPLYRLADRLDGDLRFTVIDVVEVLPWVPASNTCW